MNTMKSAMPKLLSGHHTRNTSFMDLWMVKKFIEELHL